jgi:hypothetical protein
MNTPTVDERKRWWLLCHAYTSLEKAEMICQQIIHLCSSNDHPLFLPLSVSTHIFYGRAFKKSRAVGFLKDDIIPADSTGIHKWLIHFRDSVFAHTDADHFEAAGKPMHDLVYSISDDDTKFLTSDPRPRPEAYADVLKHIVRMKELIFSEIRGFHKKYSELLPKENGDYLFLLDGEKVLFELHRMPTEANLHYR